MSAPTEHATDSVSAERPCVKCNEPTHPEDMTDPPGWGTEWDGVCLLCYEKATRPLPPAEAMVALALHDMALAADQEGRRYRTARNREVAELYAAGMSGGEIGRVLGVGRRAVHNMIADAKDE